MYFNEEQFREAFTNILGSNLLDGLSDKLTMLPSNSSAWASIRSLYGSLFVPLAWSIMLMFFMIHLVDELSYKELTPEKLFKNLAKLLLAACIVANGFTLMELFLKLGVGVVGRFSAITTSPGASSTVDELVEWARVETEGFKLLRCMGLSVQLFVPWIASLIMGVIVTVICYSRYLELMVKTLFAPIVLCDVFSDSYERSASIRYFRGYVSTCLQGAVIYGIGWVYSQVSADLLINPGASGMTYMLGFLAVNFAVVLLMIKSGSFAKELCGVG